MLVIRMRRVGSKKRPFFRIVVTEHSSPRDGAFVEVVGTYNPRTKPETLTIDRERVDHWIKQGARPSDSVRTLISRAPEAPAAAEGARGAAEAGGSARSAAEAGGAGGGA